MTAGGVKGGGRLEVRETEVREGGVDAGEGTKG